MQQLRISRSRRMLFLAATLAAVVGASTAFVSWRRGPVVNGHPVDTGSPYENTRLGVKYVGDAVCALPCGDRRELPPASDGPFARSDRVGARDGE